MLLAILMIVAFLLGRFFVVPIRRLRRLISEIADSLVFYANVYCSPGFAPQAKSDEASEALRYQAYQLRNSTYEIPWYPLWESLKIVRKKTEIEEASEELMGLAKSVHGGMEVSGGENSRKRERVEKLLGIVRDKELSGG
jgi:hypothetical protein